MSRHALDASHYTSQETLSRERAHLFGALWTFVGFTSMVRERNQFFTRKVAGVPILVQRTEAGIRAFINECPHRLSPIQTESAGKRPMVCPYHAWSFGAEGELRGIPNHGLYQFSAAEREKICLKKLHLEEVGQLLFVNFAQSPIALNEQFTDEFIGQLQDVSSHLDSQIIYSCHKVRYNWKLNMENVKDYNHVPFIHPQTFMPAMNQMVKEIPVVGDDGASEVIRLISAAESPELDSLSYSTKALIKPYENWFAPLCEKYGSEHAYYNWFIYPNVNFCSVKGDHFLLQQYDPVSPGVTDYHLWMMTATRKDVRTDFTALLATLIRGERKVIAEDTVVLERLQDGFGEHSRRFMHGEYEAHIVQQHLWYRTHVLGERP
ncbi:aromatic ring-hydroxylating oxygenase subunit alpha [Pseudomonas protegens]|jgi:phenylpropionate dioxygenase-like ring-hydroxylating dioxygenase large terminal subunit|uniref:aromatic ring-hydroxylating oxygenase subunit alpha n=1 Tax=Pseudomonas protegens TaxID=380021 RepID=UPI000A8E5231|nr:aromatic ring-hydroxylating dioxygenase subunit alpha [Pseudomonas protegens]